MTLVGGMLNIGPITDQVPEPLNERIQEDVWTFIGEVLINIPDVLFWLAEFLVSIP